jgi:hypothetical protein
MHVDFSKNKESYRQNENGVNAVVTPINIGRLKKETLNVKIMSIRTNIS